MKLFKRIIPAFVIFALLLILTSCGGYNFYNDFKAKGATLENGDSFVVLTLDEVKTKRDAKETAFMILIGSSDIQNSVNGISKIQDEFNSVNYDGVTYFVNAKEAITYYSKGQELEEKLGISSIHELESSGLIVVEYDKNGRVLCDTSKTNDEASKKFSITGSLSFRAVADYIVEYYPVAKASK